MKIIRLSAKYEIHWEEKFFDCGLFTRSIKEKAKQNKRIILPTYFPE
jgi:hypothetical protein